MENDYLCHRCRFGNRGPKGTLAQNGSDVGDWKFGNHPDYLRVGDQVKVNSQDDFFYGKEGTITAIKHNGKFVDCTVRFPNIPTPLAYKTDELVRTKPVAPDWENLCPQCEQNPKAQNDYLCQRCRFGKVSKQLPEGIFPEHVTITHRPYTKDPLERDYHDNSWPIMNIGNNVEVGPFGAFHERVDWSNHFGRTGRIYPNGAEINELPGPHVEWYGPGPEWETQDFHLGGIIDDAINGNGPYGVPWRPGVRGKGYVHPDYGVRTWEADPFPHHPYLGGKGFALYIKPDGSTSFLGRSEEDPTPELQQTLRKHHPGLRLTDEHKDWKFGASQDWDNWDPNKFLPPCPACGSPSTIIEEADPEGGPPYDESHLRCIGCDYHDVDMPGLSWQEGKPGKGILFKNGELHNWNIGGEGGAYNWAEGPHHAAYNAYTPYGNGTSLTFNIQPDGEMDAFGSPYPDTWKKVQEIDPRLKRTDWRFGGLIPEPKSIPPIFEESPLQERQMGRWNDGRVPIIYYPGEREPIDESEKPRVTVGMPGTHHVDYFPGFTIPDKAYMGNFYPGSKDWNPRLEWTTAGQWGYEKPPPEHIDKAVRQYFGLQPQEEWRMSSDLRLNDKYNVPDWVNVNEVQGGGGMHGEGSGLPGVYNPDTKTMHISPTEDLHWDVIHQVPELEEAFGRPDGFSAPDTEVMPMGRLVNDKWDWYEADPFESDWRFGSNEPEIREWETETSLPGNWAWRRPVLYHKPTNILHVGQPMAEHDDLQAQLREAGEMDDDIEDHYWSDDWEPGYVAAGEPNFDGEMIAPANMWYMEDRDKLPLTNALIQKFTPEQFHPQEQWNF
jgi:hypothetical protein